MLNLTEFTEFYSMIIEKIWEKLDVQEILQNGVEN
jgi:hypothetical protein